MKLAYMVATPDVAAPAHVTAIQGPMDRALAVVRATGYTGVEFLVADPARIDRKALARAVADTGLDVPAICTGEVYGQDGLSFADPDPARRALARQRMHAAMDLAGEYGAMVNVGRLRGRFVEGVARDQTLAWIGEAIAEALDRTQGVPVVLEPVNRQYANCLMTTAEALAFVRGLGLPGLALMLDTVHMLVEGEDIETSCRETGDLFLHFHITDSDRLPVGMGTYDIAAIMADVVASGFDATVTVETFQPPDGETACRQSYAAMQEVGIAWERP